MADDPFADQPIVLSDADLERLQRWIDAVKPLMGLQSWWIGASPRRCNEGSLATTSMREDSEDAWVALRGPIDREDPVRLRWTLTHELLHLHLTMLITAIASGIKGELGNTAEALWLDALGHLQERAIDRMAAAWAMLLPLVQETTGGTPA